MERNIRHVQRWLERCLEAYKCKRRGAALAELESARAELEIAREVLAEELAGRKPLSSFSPGRFFRVALTSLVLLFSLALPTAHKTDPAVSPFRADGGSSTISLEMVTEEERILLQNLRKPPAVAQTPPQELLPEVSDVPQLTAQVVKSSVPVIPEKQSGADAPEKAQNTVQEPENPTPASDKLDDGVSAPGVEEFMSLLQVGQRALQSPEKRISIEP